MKKTIYLLVFMCAYLAEAQINEPFNDAVPSDWGEWSDSFISWEHNTDFGNQAAGCVMISNTGATGSKTRLETPFVDLSIYLNPEIDFSVALIKNNFLAPSVALLYDIGGGWVMLEQWNGDGDNNPIDSSFNPDPTLSQENVNWVDLSYDLVGLANQTNIRFAIQAEITNGGWVLVDDINMTNDGLNNLSVSEQANAEISIYPNPTNGLTFIQADPLYYSKFILSELSGKNIREQEIHQSETLINVGGLSKGVYFVSLYKGDVLKVTKKIIIE